MMLLTSWSRQIEVNPNGAIRMWCDVMWYYIYDKDMIWYDWYDGDMIWYDMIWYDMIWYDTLWYDITYDMTYDVWYCIYDIIYDVYDIEQRNATQHNTTQYHTMQCNAIQYNTTQHNTIQYASFLHTEIAEVVEILAIVNEVEGNHWNKDVVIWTKLSKLQLPVQSVMKI